MRAPPSSPYQTKAAIPLYVRSPHLPLGAVQFGWKPRWDSQPHWMSETHIRPSRGGHAWKPQTYPERPHWDSEAQWRPLGLGAEETPAKTVHKMFWPALGGVIAAVWFFSRTQQPQKSPSK